MRAWVQSAIRVHTIRIFWLTLMNGGWTRTFLSRCGENRSFADAGWFNMLVSDTLLWSPNALRIENAYSDFCESFHFNRERRKKRRFIDTCKIYYIDCKTMLSDSRVRYKKVFCAERETFHYLGKLAWKSTYIYINDTVRLNIKVGILITQCIVV